MNKELVIEFNELVVKPNFVDKFLYIADSWSAQSDQELYYNIFGENCKLLIIPPHCTSLLQPLDVYFFRF